MDFAILADLRVKLKESETIDKYFDPARELKTNVEKGDGDTTGSWGAWNGLQRPGRKTGGIADQRKHCDYLHLSCVIS